MKSVEIFTLLHSGIEHPTYSRDQLLELMLNAIKVEVQKIGWACAERGEARARARDRAAGFIEKEVAYKAAERRHARLLSILGDAKQSSDGLL